MPRYRVTVVDEVTVIELDGVVTTRRFWWLGVVDGLLLQGRRHFVVNLQGARLRTFADARFVGAVAERILGSGGQVAFVPPPGRRAAARVHSVARTHQAMAAPSVESAVAAVSVSRNR
jgi:hypothetical protein